MRAGPYTKPYRLRAIRLNGVAECFTWEITTFRNEVLTPMYPKGMSAIEAIRKGIHFIEALYLYPGNP